MSVSGRIVFPNYAIMVALACVGGACNAEDTTPPSQTSQDCSCPPSINLAIDGTAREMSLCNNATFDWLVHTLLAQIAIEKEQVVEKTAYIKTLAERMHIDTDEIDYLLQEKKDLAAENNKLISQNEELLKELDKLRAHQAKGTMRPMDCADIKKFGFHYSGLYTVYPHRGVDEGVRVFCDLNTEGGGWLLIQRRMDGSENFARNWVDYKNGFGKINREFWLGLDLISNLTSQRRYELRVDMTDYDGVSGHALYKKLMVEDESTGYRLRAKGYSGDAGNGLIHHNKYKFTTQDVDNDRSKSGQCSHLFGNGGWWYVRCYDSNLNGQYGQDRGNKGVVWFPWKDDYTPLREVEMKIRPAGYLEQ